MADTTKSIVTEIRQKQIGDLKDLLEQWFWKSIEGNPSGDDGEFDSIKFDLIRAGYYEGTKEDLFTISITRKSVEIGP